MRTSFAVAVYLFFFVAAVRASVLRLRLVRICAQIFSDLPLECTLELGFKVTLPDERIYVRCGIKRSFRSPGSGADRRAIEKHLRDRLSSVSDYRIEASVMDLHFDGFNHYFIYFDDITWTLVDGMDEARRRLTAYPGILRYMKAASDEFMSMRRYLR